MIIEKHVIKPPIFTQILLTWIEMKNGGSAVIEDSDWK